MSIKAKSSSHPAETSTARAEVQLREAAVRLTSARVKVLAALLDADRAFSHQDMQDAFTDMDRVTLYRALDCLTDAGLAHKISGPSSTVLMPLLAAVAAFGLARSGQVLLRACVGMALGFAYFVADNFSLAMGNVGAYPPVVAAWAPFLLFLLIGETVLVRTEE